MVAPILPKRVLIAAYFYPPRNSIASLRPLKLAKYLPEFGWEPLVLTAAAGPGDSGMEGEPDVSVYRTPEAFSLFSPFLKKDPRAGFWRYGADTALRILKEKPFQLLFTTSGPMRANRLGAEIQRRTGLPWVADFRDLWTDNHYQKSRSPLALWRMGRAESRCMRGAAAMTTVSKPWADMLRARHGRERRCLFIPNGFDAEDYAASVPLLKTFTLTYSGALYSRNSCGRRDLGPLFEAVARLKQDGTVCSGDFKIRFMGSERAHVEGDAAQWGIADLVRACPRVSYRESVQSQKESTALLMLCWNGPEEQGVYSGKIFEYLGAARPILCIPRNRGSVVERLLEDTCAGELCSDPTEIEAVLRRWIHDFKAGGTLPYSVNRDKILPFTRREQARRFAELFDSLSGGTQR